MHHLGGGMARDPMSTSPIQLFFSIATDVSVDSNTSVAVGTNSCVATLQEGYLAYCMSSDMYEDLCTPIQPFKWQARDRALQMFALHLRSSSCADSTCATMQCAP